MIMVPDNVYVTVVFAYPPGNLSRNPKVFLHASIGPTSAYQRKIDIVHQDAQIIKTKQRANHDNIKKDPNDDEKSDEVKQ